MLRLVGWLCFASALPLLQAQSCGFEGSRDLGEPCTRRSDCEGRLTCSAGVCSFLDAGEIVDGEPVDVAPDEG